MLIIISFVAIAIIAIIIGIWRRIDDWANDWEPWIFVGVIVLVIAIIMGVIAWNENTYKDLYIEKKLMKYDALKMQYDNGYYNKFTYDGRKGLMDEILAYNQSVINGRAKHGSKWIGAFYPEDYDSLPLIELN